MITLPINSDLSLYLQVYETIKNEIKSGKLKANTKIYSKRKLALHLGVSLTTIDTAYAQLMAEGFIYSMPKSGYFVSEIDELVNVEFKSADKIEQQDVLTNLKVDFSTGNIDSAKFPFTLWQKIIKNCFNEHQNEVLKVAPPQGDINLREAIASYVYQYRGGVCNKNQVIIGAGTDGILQILSYILNKKATIAMENPVYNKAYDIFSKMGYSVETVEVDEQGILIEHLPNCDNSVVYVTPSHQFPLSISMPISRRTKLLNWANQGENRYIIEDDYDSEFRYDMKAIPSLKSIDNNEKVIYCGTFSKSIAPSLRIAYLILPEKLMKEYRKEINFFRSQVSKLDQLVLNEFIQSGKFTVHVNRMRNIYKRKREFLVNELKCFGDKLEVLGEKAGHQVLVRLNNGLSEQEMCSLALENGVKVYPISKYFIGEIPQKYKNQVLLGYGSLSEKEITEGVKLLKKAWLD